MSFRRLVVVLSTQMFPVSVTLAIALLAPAGHSPVFADTLPASIAVPLIGTQGPAGAYPSRMTVAARGGTNQTAAVRIVLHGVTHPCPEDLAVLLVHNNTEKFLLMSNAGSCRPLQGTDIFFDALASPIPDAQPVTPPYGFTLLASPSNYGAAPAFPSPAPAGPYTMGLPPASTNVNGTWDLYVLDTTLTNRGVIAGGWALLYNTNVVRPASQTLVALPGVGTGPGTAATYPITFDVSTAPPDVPVMRVFIEVVMRHTFPDDVRLALQSPTGTTVMLMANAGGEVDIAPGTALIFADGGLPLPDATAITTGTYAPTAFGTLTLPGPAPPLPYATTLADFIGEPIRGTWRLWAFDDASGDSGQITSATLTIETEEPPAPTLTPVPPATTDQPFVRVDGVVGLLTTLPSPHHAEWRVTNGGVFYDAGAFLFVGSSNTFTAEVPLKKGTNTIQYRVRNTRGQSLSTSVTVTVNELTYSFAEGATGTFFDLDVIVANPSAVSAPVAIDFLPEGGGTLTFNDTVAPNTPLPVAVDSLVPAASVSTVVRSTDAVPLAVERTMIWDPSGYGGHGGTAVGPSTRWLFAEGSQGFFNTFVLLANDNPGAVDVVVKFLLEGGGVVTVPINVLGKTRHTLFAGSVAALVNQSFGIDITATLPIIAERAMYLPGARLFEGGHESAGVNATSRQWFLAEGATGAFFDCFVLISNPNPTAPANVTLTFLLPSGATIDRSIVVPANGRHTVNVEAEDPQLANADVSTTVVSDVGIVVERAMYWPDLSVGWREAHNSFGVTASALRWGVADGRIGGPRAFQTFILLANPNPFPAEVEVRFLKPTFTVTRMYTLNPSSRRSIYANVDVPELGDGTFSADVQVLNYQPIAVEKALYWNSGPEPFAGGTNVTATRLPPP